MEELKKVLELYNKDDSKLSISDMIKYFGIYKRQQITEFNVSTQTKEEKEWIDSNIIKYSEYHSFVRYEWLLEDNEHFVVYACGGKIIKIFPNEITLKNKQKNKVSKL